ncbi:hypothetical protein ACFQ1S_20105 [Kibdelosporangium lantanae]|uniref:Transcriptional regulator n=1 Tax=Kibdelosporangium lantanae TaxID=1497396 RepID=A0ABW3MAN1_9PSEU
MDHGKNGRRTFGVLLRGLREQRSWSQEHLADLADRYKARGWDLTEAKYLDAAEIEALETSWTKRLNSSRQQLDVLSLTGTTTR